MGENYRRVLDPNFVPGAARASAPSPAPLATPVVIVEDGSIVAGANSYIGVAYADTFHNGTVYNDVWENADPPQKAAAVINATRAIDANMNFNGYIIDQHQPLKWPRVYCPNPEMYLGYPYGGYPVSMGAIGYGYYPSNEIPKVLMDATAQEALEILRLDRLSDNAAYGIQSMQVDVISLTFKSGQDGGGVYQPMSDLVENMLLPLGTPRSGAGYASIPVARIM